MPFKETCINKFVRDKTRKEKQEYEKIGENESSSSEEDTTEIYATDLLEESKEQMSLAEFLQKQKEHEEARETLKQEQVTSDVYLEKIYYTKLFRDKPQEIERLGIGRGNAHDVTANQKVRFKVKCVGLDFDMVSHWLVQEET